MKENTREINKQFLTFYILLGGIIFFGSFPLVYTFMSKGWRWNSTEIILGIIFIVITAIASLWMIFDIRKEIKQENRG